MWNINTTMKNAFSTGREAFVLLDNKGAGCSLKKENKNTVEKIKMTNHQSTVDCFEN